VGTGLAIGRHHFRPVIFAATALAALLIQIGTNFANDYFDYQKGADTPARIGPTRITSAGLATPRTVLRATIIAFGSASLLGVYLVVQGGWPILVVGILSILAGVAYTGGPIPFGYHGLGDAICFLFFGVVAVSGTYYLQAGSLSASAVLASIPVACLVTAILVVNNVRDIESDRTAGKMTLATRLGRQGTRVEYGLLLAVAYLFPILLAARGATPWWLFWLPWATVPLAISLMKVVSHRIDGRSLNVALKGTGRLHLFFGVLFALSLTK
jgi:1,4-dihydroxy-2-naphthoate octaprenyltransferase